MNTASLENCKRLYELSGWKDTTLRFIVSDDKFPRLVSQVNVEETDELYPAYDLGYLLRKLPKQHMALAGTTAGVVFNVKTGKWACDYTTVNTSGNHKGHLIEADTPEDAACLLAQRLFEEGILKR